MTKKKHDTPIDIIEDEVKELEREYKHFERFRDENSLLMGVFVLGIAALVLINTLFWVHLTRNRADQESKQISSIASAQTTSLQTARNFALSAKVQNVTENTATDKAFPLPNDQTLLIMDIAITNKTKTKQQLIPVNQLFVRSSEGDYSPLHASMHVISPLAAQDVAPGKTVHGQLSFAIPKRVDTPLLYIDTGWGKSTPLVIDVLH